MNETLGLIGLTLSMLFGFAAPASAHHGVDSIYPNGGEYYDSYSCGQRFSAFEPNIHCQSDNGGVSVYLGALSPNWKTAVQANGSYDISNKISITYESTPRQSGGGETDIYYVLGTLDPLVYGQTSCNDPIGTYSGYRCDQHYVTFDSTQACLYQQCAAAVIANNTRSMACHETGHTFGLQHGQNSWPKQSQTDAEYACMRTANQNGYFNPALGPHNGSQIDLSNVY